MSSTTLYNVIISGSSTRSASIRTPPPPPTPPSNSPQITEAAHKIEENNSEAPLRSIPHNHDTTSRSGSRAGLTPSCGPASAKLSASAGKARDNTITITTHTVLPPTPPDTNHNNSTMNVSPEAQRTREMLSAQLRASLAADRKALERDDDEEEDTVPQYTMNETEDRELPRMLDEVKESETTTPNNNNNNTDSTNGTVNSAAMHRRTGRRSGSLYSSQELLTQGTAQPALRPRAASLYDIPHNTNTNSNSSSSPMSGPALQRALVQYNPPTNTSNYSHHNNSASAPANAIRSPRSSWPGHGSLPQMATTTGASLHRASTDGSESRRSPSRHAEVCAMLVGAERELAAVRAESNRRGAELEDALAAQHRAEAAIRTLKESHRVALDAMRSEHAAQTRQLRQQITLLKSISERAMTERGEAMVHAARRKDELLTLLDREREEKSAIMAEYRAQTESLITEQGKEITRLRDALEKMKAEYDRVLAEQQEQNAAHMQELTLMREQHASAMEKLKADFTRRLNEWQSHYDNEKEVLVREEQRRAAQIQQQVLEEQAKRAAEAMQRAEEAHSKAIEALRVEHQRALEELQQRHALEKARNASSRQVEEQRREWERRARSAQATTEELRTAVEELTREKEQLVEQFATQQAEVKAAYETQLAALQSSLTTTTNELNAERTARKDAAATLEVMQVRSDQLDRTVQTLSAELTRSQEEQRSRERGLSVAHAEALETLRSQLRRTASELTQLEQTRRQDASGEQKLREELTAMKAALAQASQEQEKLKEQHASELSRVTSVNVEKTKALSATCDELRRQRTTLEMTLHETQVRLHELEAQLATSAQEAAKSRDALQTMKEEVRQRTADVQRLNAALAQSEERSAQMQRELEEELHRTHTAMESMESVLQERQRELARLQKTRDAILAEAKQKYESELTAMRLALRESRDECVTIQSTLNECQAALRVAEEDKKRLAHDAAEREAALTRQLASQEEAHDEELHRMDGVVDELRSDLAKAQAMCGQYQEELALIHRDAEAQCAELELAVAQSEASRVKLHEDARYREQVNQELQGTVRLMSGRLTTLEDDLKRAQAELTELHRKLQDVHTQMGRREATIGQLNAKLRAYEARDGAL